MLKGSAEGSSEERAVAITHELQLIEKFDNIMKKLITDYPRGEIEPKLTL